MQKCARISKAHFSSHSILNSMFFITYFVHETDKYIFIKKDKGDMSSRYVQNVDTALVLD